MQINAANDISDDSEDESSMKKVDCLKIETKFQRLIKTCLINLSFIALVRPLMDNSNIELFKSANI